ncbi:gliding motility-associated protein GldE [Psychroflexus salis]|uniref:gliding motility-associated protein GldE n=1 Tax=Psychroflexus salis TaxID=1526574 RepID=UPI00166AE671|nr:gliding motility-associated protein GldE [Psychroflexus salis]
MEPDPQFFVLLLAIDFTQIFSILLFLLLLACSALISGSEVALFSLKPSDFNTSGELSEKEKILVHLLDRPKKLLATILVANNFINIAIVLLYSSLSSVIHGNNDYEIFGFSLVFWIDVIVVTFLILFFGEILPKVYANRNNVKFAQFMAFPLSFLDKLISPLSIPMRNTTRFIEKNFGKQKSNLSIDQLSQALELTREEDTSNEEKKILQGIVSFGNIDAKQAMQPRLDIFALSIDEDFETVLNKISENGYSRIPVYKESIDEVQGLLYIKDLLKYIHKKNFDWQSLIREAYFVPENKKLDDLLNEFKEKKIHSAIVVDEYGGTSGLISLEDIIEEIVGDISDEFDDDDIIFSKLDTSTYVFEGKTTLKDFYHILKFEEEQEKLFEDYKGEAETIAGFVLEIAKSFPKVNQILNFDNYTFTIEALDQKRIKQIKVKVNI